MFQTLHDDRVSRDGWQDFKMLRIRNALKKVQFTKLEKKKEEKVKTIEHLQILTR